MAVWLVENPQRALAATSGGRAAPPANPGPDNVATMGTISAPERSFGPTR